MLKIMKTFTNTHDGNLAFHVGDDPLNVEKNRKIIARKYNYDGDKLRYMEQVHGNTVQIVTSTSPLLIESCDGIITNEKNLPLMVMVADCIPILLWDEIQGVIAAVHAGRNSTFQEIVQETVGKMIDTFACKSENIHAQLGPSIQKCCYEVSSELATIVANSFGVEFVNNRLIDLQGINKKQLLDLGVNHVEISEICTKCSSAPYFSYRLDKHTGRFAGLIMLHES